MKSRSGISRRAVATASMAAALLLCVAASQLFTIPLSEVFACGLGDDRLISVELYETSADGSGKELNSSTGELNITPPETTERFGAGDTVGYKDGTRATLEASPSSGYRFGYWQGDYNDHYMNDDAQFRSYDNPVISLQNTDDETVKAVFIRQCQVSLSADPATGGSVGVSPTPGPYDRGTVLTFTATPNAGWVFSEWGGQLTGIENLKTIQISDNMNAIARFRRQLTVRVTGAGSVENAASTLLAWGDDFEDHDLDSWTTIGSRAWTADNGGVRYATPADKALEGTIQHAAESNNLELEFDYICYDTSNLGYTLLVAFRYDGLTGQEEKFLISPSAIGMWHWQDEYVHLSLVSSTADTLYRIRIVCRGKDVVVSRKPQGGAWTELFNYTVSQAASSQAIQFTETAGADYALDNISISYPQYLTDGSTETLAAAPNTESVFDSWSGDLTGTTNPESILMNGAKEVSAEFTYLGPPSLTVTVTNPSAGAELVRGDNVVVQWRVDNAQGGPAAAPWSDAVYLSRDNVLDGSDKLLATVENTTDIGPGGYITQQHQFSFPDVSPGTYWLLVEIDTNGEVEELSEGDNLGVTAIVTVDPVFSN